MKNQKQIRSTRFGCRSRKAASRYTPGWLGQAMVAFLLAWALPATASVDAAPNCDNGSCVMLVAAADNNMAPTGLLESGDLWFPEGSAMVTSPIGGGSMGGGAPGGVASGERAETVRSATIATSALFSALAAGVLLLAAFNTRKRRARAGSAELSRH